MKFRPGDEWTAKLIVSGLPKLNIDPLKYPESYNFDLIADPLHGVAESNEDKNVVSIYANLENCVMTKSSGYPGSPP